MINYSKLIELVYVYLFILLSCSRPARLDCRQTKVTNLHGKVVIVEEDVVRLEISVDDVLGVEVVHALTSLSGYLYHIE